MGYEKGIICTKKRFLHQKSEEKRKKHSHVQKGTIKIALEKAKRLGEKIIEMGKIVAEEIQ